MGGDPSKLGDILSKDKNGTYYALSCSLQNMDACMGASNGLLTYAESDFNNQFSFETGEGITPLGEGFTKHHPIRYIGLDDPPSYVNSDVTNARDSLSTYLDENKYYNDQTRELLYGYKVSWNASSEVF